MMKYSLLVIALAFFAASEAFMWRASNSLGTVRGFQVLEASPNMFSFVAFQADPNSTIADAIQFSFSTLGTPSIGVRYLAHEGNIVEAAASRIGFRKLVEYIEEGAHDSGFDPNNDTLVQSYYLWNQTWTNFQYNLSNTSAVKSICTSTVDKVVTICVFAANRIDLILVNGTFFEVDPNALTITLNISHFPFHRNSSLLALKSSLEVQKAVAVVGSSGLNANQSAFDLGQGPFQPALAWNNVVNVTGPGCAATAQVVVSNVLDSESSRDIDLQSPFGQQSLGITLALTRKIVYHSFITNCPEPSNIFWDPEFGIAVVGVANPASVILPSIALLLAVLALFL